MKTIFERLKEERNRLGLNQSEFAAIGGVQKGAQINYEQGKRNPDSDYLSAIAAAKTKDGKSADVQYILTGERHPFFGLHERLQDERDLHKLTVAQAAERFGLAKLDWIAIEHGQVPITRELLAKLSAHGWDLGYLLVGIRQGMMAAGEPLKGREADLVGKLKHATDADWAAIKHIANLIAR